MDPLPLHTHRPPTPVRITQAAMDVEATTPIEKTDKQAEEDL